MSLEDAYAAEACGTSVRARAVRLYLAGRSACEIAILLGRTTTPASITAHLRLAGLGGVHWCPECRMLEAV
jgi:hypothetical protein